MLLNHNWHVSNHIHVPLLPAEHLQQHAMTILQRDIHREEQRLKAEADAAAAAAKAAADAEAAAAAATSSPMVSPTSPAMSNPFTGLPVESSPDGTNTKSLPTPTRRQSTVSLSSLQRPNFQHKLDLSGASMRINPDEFLTIPSGLSSPVTLAPKSSHRAIPQDLVMALSEANRPVDIDLTVADADMEMQQAAGAAAAASLDPTVGTSADKPIELDLDMDGLFSAAADSGGSESHQQLFGQPSTHPLGGEVSNITPNVKPKQEEDFFSDALNTGTASGNMGDILTSLSGVVPTGSGQPTNMGDVTHSSLSTSGPMKAPSPGTILAGFDAVQHPPQGISGQSNDAHFDINSMDLGGFGAGMFDANPQDAGMSVSEMEDMFNLDGTGGQNTTAAP